MNGTWNVGIGCWLRKGLGLSWCLQRLEVKAGRHLACAVCDHTQHVFCLKTAMCVMMTTCVVCQHVFSVSWWRHGSGGQHVFLCDMTVACVMCQHVFFWAMTTSISHSSLAFLGWSVYPCTHPPVHPSTHPCIYPSTCPSVLPSFLTSSFSSIYLSLSSSHSSKFNIVVLRSLNCIHFVCTYVLALHSLHGTRVKVRLQLARAGVFHRPFLGIELRSYVLGGIFFLTEPSRWPLLTLICRREVTNLWNGLSLLVLLLASHELARGPCSLKASVSKWWQILLVAERWDWWNI